MNRRAAALCLFGMLAPAACTPTTGRPALTGDAEAQGVAENSGNPAGGLSLFDTLRVDSRLGEPR